MIRNFARKVVLVLLSLYVASALPQSHAAQNSIVMPTTGPHTMADFAGILNNGLQSLGTTWSGPSAPAGGPGNAPMAYQFWADTSTTPNTLRIYDGSSWVAIGTLDIVGHGFSTPITQPVNAVSGANYTYLGTDCGKLVTRANGASAMSDTLPRAGFAGIMGSGCYLDVSHNGSAGTLTITPSISTVCGGASTSLAANQSIRLISDGVNWQCTRGQGSSYTGVSAVTCGTGMTGGTITTSGTCNVDPALALTTPTATTPTTGDNSTRVATTAGVYNILASYGLFPSWVTLADGTGPKFLADFTTEATTGHYWYNTSVYGNASAWLSAIGGSFTRASPATYYNSVGTLTTASNDVMRFDYDPVSHVPKGLLQEGARTNEITHSGDVFSWPNNATDIAFTANAVTAPDASSYPYAVIPTAVNAAHYVGTSTVSQSSGTASQSVYVKPIGGYTKIAVRESGAVGFYASFNCTGAGIVLDFGTGATGATIALLANGWYRLTMIYPVSSLSNYNLAVWFLPTTYTTGVPNGSWTPNGTDGWWVWGGQYERAGFSSSYIPTTTTTATRAADVLTIPYSHTAPTTLLLGAYDGPSSVFDWITTGGSATFEVLSPKAGSVVAASFFNGGASASINLGSAASGSNKAALYYDATKGGGSLNGAAVVNSTTFANPPNTAPNFNSGVAATWLTKIGAYNVHASDAALQAMSAP